MNHLVPAVALSHCRAMCVQAARVLGTTAQQWGMCASSQRLAWMAPISQPVLRTPCEGHRSQQRTSRRGR